LARASRFIALHLVGEEPVALVLRGRAADQRHLGVAVEEDLLEPVVVFEVLQRLRPPAQRGIPARPADRVARPREAVEPRVVAQEMRVHVHDELAGERLRALGRDAGRRRLGAADAVERPVDVVHRRERRGHARGAAKEGAARLPVPWRELLGEIRDPGRDLLLPRGSRGRHELVAGDDPRGQRPAEHYVLRRLELGEFFRGQHGATLRGGDGIILADVGGRSSSRLTTGVLRPLHRFAPLRYHRIVMTCPT
jgi:hypothetical protein